jgi:hypothetical protein
MLKRVVGIVATVVLAAPAPALAQPVCYAARAALVELFAGQSGKYDLGAMGNPGRVKLFLDQAGPCLSRAFSADPDAECGYGWYELNAGGRPIPAQPPAKETLDALMTAATLDAVVTCPGIRAATQAIVGWRKPSSKPAARDRREHYIYVGMTLPVVAAGEAIVWIEQQSGPLAGGSELVLLRMDATGRWVLAGRLPMSVS